MTMENINNHKKTVGNKGEDIACDYLKKNGYRILFRNLRKPWGELDIVAKDKDKAIVIFEVKTMTIRQSNAAESGNCRINNQEELRPEDNMSAFKISKTKKMASYFANENEDLINEKIGWRVDLITISIDFSGEISIKHYKNI